MAEIFRCPSCSAPLKFQAKMVQTCQFCNSDVIVPAHLAKPTEKIASALEYVEPYPVAEEKPRLQEDGLADASNLGQKALKVAEIKRAIKENNKLGAALLFRDNFGGSLADAVEIIKSIEEGKSVYVPGIKPEAPKSSSSKRIVWAIALAVLFLLLLVILIPGFWG